MKKIFLTFVIIALIVVGFLIVNSSPAKAPTQKSPASKAKNNDKKTDNPAKFDKQKFSLTDPSSLWVVVNKTRPLEPKTYVPQLVVPDIPLRSGITADERHVSTAMAPALESMVAAAKAQGVNLNLQSGYRSYELQVSLYNRYVNTDGKSKADTYSARPGYSEHQTGLAADLGGTSNPSCNVAQCFANTVEGRWLAKNAWQYGFIMRYPRGKDGITGYEWEPWHFRYIGKPLAAEMHKTGTDTLEKFFGLPSAPLYT